MLRATVVPVTAFAQNCSVVWCDRTGAGAVIDPGGDLEQVLEAVRESGMRLEKILLTHAHIDHAGGTAELARSLKLPIEGPHVGDKFWIDGLPEQARMFGLPACERFVPDRWLVDGDRVRVRGPERPRAADVITSPFPGFATDMQAQFMALLGLADDRYQSLYHFTVGHSLEDPRLTTLPPYSHLHDG